MPRIDLVLCCSALARPGLLAAGIALSGCVPIPYPHHRVLEGTEITEQQLKALRVNETTRSQVLEKFGPPDVDFVDQRVIAYAWSGTSSGLLLATAGGSGGHGMLGRLRRALLVRFDAADRVTAFSIVDRPETPIPYDPLNQPPHARAEEWRVILAEWLATHPPAK